MVLCLNVAFLPKVLSHTHLNQSIQFAHFDSPSEEGGSELLCPVRALKAYIAATASIRQSAEMFVCHSGPNRGCTLSRRRLFHWVVDTITHAYGASGTTSGIFTRFYRANVANPRAMIVVLRLSSAASNEYGGCWILCDLVSMGRSVL